MPSIKGCDFTSRPTKQKPITLAVGALVDPGADPKRALPTALYFHLHELLSFTSLDDFEQALKGRRPGVAAPWVGGFDLPFGLPRELIQTLGWPLQWDACVNQFCALERARIRELFKNFCDKRSVGSKFAHRATDYIANSSPSMKWVNPPVAFMMHAGLPTLIRANLTLPGIRHGDAKRIGLETYPGMLAREIIGHQSYKSDDKHKQNRERLLAREKILDTLAAGHYSLGFKVKADNTLWNQMLADASGDSLDALICALQATWGLMQFKQGDALYGLAPEMDPLEGWILTC